jgi:hypothetical protein
MIAKKSRKNDPFIQAQKFHLGGIHNYYNQPKKWNEKRRHFYGVTESVHATGDLHKCDITSQCVVWG